MVSERTREHAGTILVHATAGVAGIALVLLLAAAVAPGRGSGNAAGTGMPELQARIVLGTGAVDAGGVTLQSLDNRGRALVSVQPDEPVDVTGRRFVAFNADGLPSHLQLSFFWRGTGQARRLLIGPASGSGVYHIDHPGWSGPVREFGFLVESAFPWPPRNTDLPPLRLSLPAFSAGDLPTRSGAITTSLTLPRYWSGTTPNTTAPPPERYRYGPSRPSFAALCGAAALLLSLLAGLVVNRRLGIASHLATGLATGWLVLGGLHWLAATQQVHANLAEYGETETVALETASPDWPVRETAQQLEKLLDEAGIPADPGTKVGIHFAAGPYSRERLYYHLLPRNTWPFYQFDPLCRLKGMDYLLVSPQSRNPHGRAPKAVRYGPGCQRLAILGGGATGEWLLLGPEEE